MRNILATLTASAALVCTVSACSDSTGPLVDARGALQSLSLGIGGVADPTAPEASTLSASLDVLEPVLGQVNVSIDGTSRTMYGLGVRETFPDGTCEEDVFVDPNFPPPVGQCTPASLGTTLILWESHAANRPPERLILIAADEGTTNFSFADDTDPLVTSALAVYIEGQDFWFSNSGSLTTSTTSTGQSCSIGLPPYAKSATCSFAAFDEVGSITFDFLSENGTSSAQRTITIPHQTLHGIWEQITEVQPITLSSAITRALSRQSVRGRRLSVLDRFQKPVRR